ncbi:MAG: hypothetical protein IKK43_06100 [Clostridia bacterium]|nr:hypothetical protein [Clostridia bacterium]
MEPNDNEMLDLNNVKKNNVVQKQKSLKKVLVLLIILLVSFSNVVFAAKGDEKKFYELLMKKQAVSSMLGEMKDGQRDTKIKIDVDDIAETLNEDIDEKVELEFNITEVKKKNNFSSVIEFLLNDEEIFVLEYAKTNNLIGARVKDMTEKFIGFENKNLQEMFENLNVPDADKLPNKLLLSEDFKKASKIKKTDVNRMLDKYIKVLAKNSENLVEVEKNVELKINNEKVKTNKYTLALTEEDTFELSKAVLETMKDDQKNIKLVLNNYKAILELMEKNNYPTKDIFGITSKDIPNVNDVLEQINEEYEDMLEIAENYKFDDEEIIVKICVYEFKGKTIATELDDGYDKVIFKAFANKELYVGFVVEENGTKLGEVALKGTMDKKEMEAKFIIEADGEKLELFTMRQKQTSGIKNLIKLTKKNMVLLNNADENELEKYSEEFTGNAEKWLEDKEELFGDTEAFEDLFGSSSTPDTVSNAQFAMFAQEFGDYTLELKTGPYADITEKYGLSGLATTKAQRYHAAATGKEINTSVMVPEGVAFVTRLNQLADSNLYYMDGRVATKDIWGIGDIVCWQIKDSQIMGYRDNHKFYGDANGTETHWITQNGTVFTLPGFPRMVDGEARMYISSDVYYVSEFGEMINASDGRNVTYIHFK